MHNNSYSKFGDDFPIAALTIKQFKELYLSLHFKSRLAPIRSDVMCIDEVVKLSGYSKASIYKFTHQRLIPFHKPAHGGRRLVFIRQEVEEWMKQNTCPSIEQECNYRIENITTHRS
ncbi:helix-turn-helix transcriptional regulator [Alistipes finegoldii]|uniref:helix-turn-helix transcriptional regulator n=1 Tax=Alistipes finegoldii TaxID=214856 RepID=UPI003AB83E5C